MPRTRGLAAPCVDPSRLRCDRRSGDRGRAASVRACASRMLTREYPPEVYGGAGVHVEYLVARAAPARSTSTCTASAPTARRARRARLPAAAGLAGANPALQTLGVDLEMAAALGDADVVHSHTWYANLAGHLAALLHGIPHVVTAHSLEPQRPWKAEQLGGGYRLSSLGRAARPTRRPTRSIAVSHGMRADVLDAYPFVDPARVHVIHNGIDTELYAPAAERPTCSTGSASTRPADRALRRPDHPAEGRRRTCSRRPTDFDPDVQLVLCAGAPDTPEIAAETAGAVAELQATAHGRGLDRARCCRAPSCVQLLTARDRVRLPVGLRAAGHRQPGGDGLRDGGGRQRRRRHPGGRRRRRDRPAGALRRRPTPRSSRPAWPTRSTTLCADPARAAAMGAAGRERAVHEFGWDGDRRSGPSSSTDRSSDPGAAGLNV